MSFFENVGKKITDMSQSTIQKGKDFADVSKLNAKIAEEERKIKANYAEIGKIYVENFREEPDELFVEFIQAITDSENQIKEHKNRIEEIKTAEKCPSCGAMVKAGSEFCTACGKPMVLPQTDKTTPQDVMCECGNMIPRGTRFCTKCGKLAEVLVQNTYSAQVPVQSVVMENMSDTPINQGMQQNPYVAMNQGVQQNPYVAMNQGMQQNPYAAMNQGVQQDSYVPVNQSAPISPFAPMPVVPVETTTMTENSMIHQEIIPQEENAVFAEGDSEVAVTDTFVQEDQMSQENSWDAADSYEYQGV